MGRLLMETWVVKMATEVKRKMEPGIIFLITISWAMSFSEERHKVHRFERERNQKQMGGAEDDENTIKENDHRIHF